MTAVPTPPETSAAYTVHPVSLCTRWNPEAVPITVLRPVDLQLLLPPAGQAETDASVALAIWRVSGFVPIIDPGYFSIFAAHVRAQDAKPRTCLAIAVADTDDIAPDGEIPDAPEEREALYASARVIFADFAWRLERHWLVEWLDSPAPVRRPGIVLACPDGVAVVGSDLAPRLRPTFGALAAFPYLTADEVRATFRYCDQPEPSASDISRTLSYLEETGLLMPVSVTTEASYWARRPSVGRRPLRVFQSVLHQVASSGEELLWDLPKPAPIVADEPSIDDAGLPHVGARGVLDKWCTTTRNLAERGLRTVAW